jgi:hypothetical protein
MSRLAQVRGKPEYIALEVLYNQGYIVLQR